MPTKEKAKRMDWYKWYPRDVQSARRYQMLSPAQRGAYRDLLDECWINFPKCGIELKLFTGSTIAELLLHLRCAAGEPLLILCCTICGIRSRKDAFNVLGPAFEMMEIKNGWLTHHRLVTQVEEAIEDTVDSHRRLSGRKDRNHDGSTAPPEYNSSTTVVPTTGIQVDEKRKEEKRTDTESLASVFDEVTNRNEQTLAVMNNGRKKGEPGYYCRGEYPGINPKVIYSYCAKAWERVFEKETGSDAAYLKYPVKGWLEEWTRLCEIKGGDILVPAFELWAIKHGVKMHDTTWALCDFIRVVEEFMMEVKNPTPVRPKITAEKIKESYEVAKQQNAEMFPENKVKDEADPNSLFEEEPS